MKNQYEIRGNDVAVFLYSDDSCFETLISLQDLQLLREARNSWRAVYDPKLHNYYVQGDIKTPSGKRTSIKLHRFLLNAPKGMQVDHIDLNPLNNRRENLRIVTDAENKQNRRRTQCNSTSGIRGVSWNSARNKWRACAVLNKKYHHIGLFNDIHEAEQAVINWRRQKMPFSEMDVEKEARGA